MKKRTPISSIILYIFGIIFLIISVFMLVTAWQYTKLYLASYETTFAEMWSNSVQYMIEKFLPYFAAGVICIGIGKAISVFVRGQGVFIGGGAAPEGDDETAIRLKELREVGSIKLEEMERREKVRLDDVREDIIRDMAVHKLQREAREAEIISKLNAMGEMMGLNMDDVYARADIPVVAAAEEAAAEETDKLTGDPTLEELMKEEPAAEEPAEEL
ncbi:MAG: hypothetical protein Q4F96_00060 [Bacillota bacterium]|nr:hypothetical protein [Bacillota bacterium]